MEAGNGKREAGMAQDRRAIRTYEDIEAYQRAMRLLVPLHALVQRFPDYERFELASQVRRASKSIPANIAEGYGKKRSAREFKAYLRNSLGSANEVIVHLKIAETLGYADSSEICDLVEGYTIVAKQLHRLSETWQSFDDGKPETISHPASRVTHPASMDAAGSRPRSSGAL
jgi:four helix bundle protein